MSRQDTYAKLDRIRSLEIERQALSALPKPARLRLAAIVKECDALVRDIAEEFWLSKGVPLALIESLRAREDAGHAD